FMQHERCVPRNRLESVLISGWSEPRRFFDREIRDVDAGPFSLPLVPPDQFLALAPRLAGRFGACSIIYNAAIGRPGKAPAVTQIIRRVPRKRLVDFVRPDDPGENQPPPRGAPAGF